MRIGIDPKVDFAFKWVFGREQNEDLLLDLLNSILEPLPDRRLESVTILNPLLPGDTEDSKLAVLDILARDSRGRQYNIEMQVVSHRFLKERFLFYWAKLHAQQLFEGDDYERLRPTISVLVLDDVLFPDLAGSHQRFQLWNDMHATTFTDQLEIHLLELPKFHATLSELTTELDRWLFFLQHAAMLDVEAWPQELAVPPLQHAAKELEMLSITDIERLRYESRLKGERDYRSGMRGAREEGLEEGREVGQIQLCQELLGQPVITVAEFDRLSRVEMATLLSQLKAALRNRGNLP